MVPQTRSSVVPNGRSTIETFVGNGNFCLLLQLLPDGVAHQIGVGGVAVEGIIGNDCDCSKSANARMVVDLPVPRSPIIITPPILGSITFNSKDNFIS